MFHIYDWVQAEWAVWEDDIVQQDRQREWNRLQQIIVVHLNVTQVQHQSTCTESGDVLIWTKVLLKLKQ